MSVDKTHRSRDKKSKNHKEQTLKQVAKAILKNYANQKSIKSFDEAQSISVIKKVKDCVNTTPVLLLAVEISKSYKVSGFESMREYMQQTFSEQYPTLNRQLVAARASFKLFGPDAIGQYSDASMQTLNKLNDNELKKVKKLLEDKLGKTPDPKKVTKDFITAILLELGLKKEVKQKSPAEVLKEQIVKTYSVDESASTIAKALKAALKKPVIKQLSKMLKDL